MAARLSAHAAELRSLKAELQRLASQDSLTGLLNRREFGEVMTAAVATGTRNDHAFCLLSLDLDQLKRVNDELGHRAGDELLQAVARLITDRLRITDRAARLGGDEFAVLLPDTDIDGATTLANDLRQSISDHCPHAAHLPWTTASIGIARLLGEAEVDEVMVRADQAMYDAKRAGGDRVATQLPRFPRTTPRRSSQRGFPLGSQRAEPLPGSHVG